MSGMMVMCSKGCGEAINVTQEVMDEAQKRGVPLNVSHDICPNDPNAVRYDYKIVVEAFQKTEGGDWEKLASFGHNIESTSFKNALPGLQEGLNKNWDRVLSMADVIDSETINRQTEDIVVPEDEADSTDDPVLKIGDEGHSYSDMDVDEMLGFTFSQLTRFTDGWTTGPIPKTYKAGLVHSLLDRGYRPEHVRSALGAD